MINEDQAASFFRTFSELSLVDHDGNLEDAGLDLLLARSLIEAHGGQLAIASIPGFGSAIRFTWLLVPVDGAST